MTQHDKAYQYCQTLARQYDENFPVITLFQPRYLRRAIAAIYAFARTADDIADEGNLSFTERLTALADYQQQLLCLSQTDVNDLSPIFIALHHVIQRHHLPISLFLDLLSAFKHDLTSTHYQDDTELYDYCRLSANPIGRLLLLLHQYHDETLVAYSDALCTALQLVNFYQDIADDHAVRQRLYLPADSLAEANIDDFIPNEANSLKLSTVLRKKYLACASLLEQSHPLGHRLAGRFGWQMRMTLLMALAILLALSKQEDRDLFSCPRLGKAQWLSAAIVSLSKRSFQWRVKRLLKLIRRRNQTN